MSGEAGTPQVMPPTGAGFKVNTLLYTLRASVRISPQPGDAEGLNSATNRPDIE